MSLSLPSRGRNKAAVQIPLIGLYWVCCYCCCTVRYVMSILAIFNNWNLEPFFLLLFMDIEHWFWSVLFLANYYANDLEVIGVVMEVVVALALILKEKKRCRWILCYRSTNICYGYFSFLAKTLFMICCFIDLLYHVSCLFAHILQIF